MESLPEIRSHTTYLADGQVALRSMTSDDWPLLIEWNSNPDVVAWSDTERDSYSVDEVYAIYSEVSRTATCFIIELPDDRRPVGECWIQPMNLPRYAHLAARFRLGRIDIMIGIPNLWGRGIGTHAIGLLARHALGDLGMAAVFACDILPRNDRSLRAFARNGFVPADPRADSRADARADHGGTVDLVRFKDAQTAHAMTQGSANPSS